MKKALLICTAVALLVSLLIVPAIAAENIAAEESALNQQIEALTNGIEPLQAQVSAYLGQARAINGFVISTNPFIVSGIGVGNSMFIDAIRGEKQTKYFQIVDPEHGTHDSGTGIYYGTHVFVERKYNAMGEDQMDVMGAFPAEYYPLNQQLKAKQETLKELEAQKKGLVDQQRLVHEQYSKALWAYNTDDEKDIVLQIDNPYVLAYGQTTMIETGNMNARPVAVNGTTFVPIRAVMDAVGGITVWNADQPERVGLYLEPKEITLNLNDTTALVDGEPVTMVAAPQVIGGKTMIPLRFVSETLGMKVEWIQDTSMIKMTYSKNMADRIDQYYTDNGDGTKHFTDMVNDYQYDLPDDCQIVIPADLTIDPHIEITRADVSGYLTVDSYDGGPPERVASKAVPLTERHKMEGISSITYYENGYYYVNYGDSSQIILIIRAKSDTPIFDPDDPSISPEQRQIEYEKNFAKLQEVAEMILASIENLALG